MFFGLVVELELVLYENTVWQFGAGIIALVIRCGVCNVRELADMLRASMAWSGGNRVVVPN